MICWYGDEKYSSPDKAFSIFADISMNVFLNPFVSQ